MRDRERYILTLLAVLTVILTIGLVCYQYFSRPNIPEFETVDGVVASREAAESESRVLKIPAISPSRFANTAATAEYTGPKACIDCHASEYESYRQTAHSQAMAGVDLQEEPGEVEYFHRRSNRKYKVYHEDGQMWHQELLVKPATPEVVLSNYPVRYRIGSGNHSRSYLVETEGFLVESPLTWYTSKDAWEMSPGYDSERHGGFQRTADVGCLYCHAGRVETAQNSRFRVTIHDAAISCETCHGPGALHVEHHQTGKSVETDVDFTIVNPEHLSRDRSESICAYCHLRGAASVTLRGRTMTDFRPSLNLADFRTDYVHDKPDNSMKVVGHVEQMRRSVCYEQSETLTCTTCHNPHGTPTEESKVEYFRQKCLECHAADSCGISANVRKKSSRQDNCVVCHMPQSKTNIPHFAFTHHRIGLHGLDQDNSESDIPMTAELVPLSDTSHLDEIDQVRGLGLAYLELSDKQSSQLAFREYRLRANRLLESALADGMHDTEVDAALARLCWERNNLPLAIRLAEDALRDSGPSNSAANALFILGDSHFQQQNLRHAATFFGALTKRRRQSEDWVLLGVCHQSSGDIHQAIDALEHAAAISPDRPDVHLMLTSLYDAIGRPEPAKLHKQMATALTESSY